MMDIHSVFGLTYWTAISILVFLVAISILDENAAPWLHIQYKILMLTIRKQWLLLKMKPDMWLMKRRMKKVLRDLEKENAIRNSDADLS